MSGARAVTAAGTLPGLFDSVYRRLFLWVAFGLIFSVAPLAVVATTNWFPDSGILGFLRLVSNEDLLAVAFTLALAGSGDVLTSGERFRKAKISCGVVTLVFAVIAGFLYVVFKTHDEHIGPSAVARLIQYVYLACMVGSLGCELLAEVR